MLHYLRPAATLMLVFTFVTGVAYPLAMTGLAAIVAPDSRVGSVVLLDGRPVGSELIGQAFIEAKYFHPRPSATNAPDPSDASKAIASPYNAAGSSGSNLGPTSRDLVDRVKADVSALQAETGAARVPADAVTASASGLDPHISPENAYLQARRVAQARGATEEAMRALVASHVERPMLGFLGVPRVNVLLLNVALDKMKP